MNAGRVMGGMVQTADAGAVVRRVPFVHPVRVRRRDDHAPVERLWAVDVSPGGIFVRTPRPLHTGTPVEIFAEVDGAPVPVGRGEVAWRRTLGQAEREARLPGFGVRFDEVDPAGRGLIEEAMERLAKGVPIPLEAEALAPTLKSPVRGERRTHFATVHRVPRSSWTARALFVFVALGIAAALGYGLLVVEQELRPATSKAAALVPAPLTVAAGGAMGVDEVPHSDEAASAPGGTTDVESSAALFVTSSGDPAATPASEVEAIPGSDAAAAPVVDPLEPGVGEPRGAQEISLPSGAVKALRLANHGDELEVDLELSGPFTVTRAFSLRNPARLILDVKGLAPEAAKVLEGTQGVERIELLAREDRTRLRLMLDRPVERIRAEDSRVVAYLEPRAVTQ